MKALFVPIFTGFFLLVCPEITLSQEGNIAPGRIDMIKIARYIENVDHSDEYDRSILMYAAENGYLQSCRILIRRGADPEKQAIDGVTAAMYAADKGQARIVKLLLKKGINTNSEEIDGTTAMMMASQNGYTNIAKLLLDNGSNPKHLTANGFNALMFASQNLHTYNQTVMNFFYDCLFFEYKIEYTNWILREYSDSFLLMLFNPSG